MCDVAYALLVDRVAAETRLVQQALAASGSSRWPSVDEQIAEFNEALASPPKVMGAEERELRQALGLRT